MFKEFLLKKLIQTKLGNLPKEDQERILCIVTKNPQLFQEIATKIKHQMDSGKDQNAATMLVMREYQTQIKELMAGDEN